MEQYLHDAMQLNVRMFSENVFIKSVRYQFAGQLIEWSTGTCSLIVKTLICAGEALINRWWVGVALWVLLVQLLNCIMLNCLQRLFVDKGSTVL